MIARAVRPHLPKPGIVSVIAGSWIAALAAEASGAGTALHHHALIEGGLPLWAALGLFLLSWQLMIAAMMLPSSLPLIRLFSRTAAPQPDARRVRMAFLGGYAVVWTVFGAVAFMGDVGIHHAVDAYAWLGTRPWLIGGGVLVLAGAFQFSSLKERCLRECRHPGAFLLRHYRRGAEAGFRIGFSHGLFCLGCCWALMLVAFAMGVASLAWMALFTVIMVFEKTGPRGDRGAGPVGIALLALGGLVLAHPAWMPQIFTT